MTDHTLQSFLDSGTSFEGKISFTKTVRIDGYFKGLASADGTLVIGETGTAEAELVVRSLIVLGTFKGEVTAKERIEIGPSAMVEGVLRTPRLAVADGATLAARFEMGESRVPPRTDDLSPK